MRDLEPPKSTNCETWHPLRPTSLRLVPDTVAACAEARGRCSGCWLLSSVRRSLEALTESVGRPRGVRERLSNRRAHKIVNLSPVRCCKKTPGGAGTHTGHTGHTGARGQTDHTDEPHYHPPKPKDTNPHENRDRLNSRKNSRNKGAASPESTAPRGRLRRGRPRRTRPCLHPLPERLPAPARRRSAK